MYIYIYIYIHTHTYTYTHTLFLYYYHYYYHYYYDDISGILDPLPCDVHEVGERLYAIYCYTIAHLSILYNIV